MAEKQIPFDFAQGRLLHFAHSTRLPLAQGSGRDDTFSSVFQDECVDTALGRVIKLVMKHPSFLEYPFFLRCHSDRSAAEWRNLLFSRDSSGFGREADFSTPPLTVKL
jgi:hypothetical protein